MKLYMPQGDKVYVFELTQVLPAGSNPMTLDTILAGTAHNREVHGMSLPAATKSAIQQLDLDSDSYDDLVPRDNPVETHGQGKIVPGTGIRVDDPRVRYVMLPRRISMRAAREKVAKLGGVKVLRLSRVNSTDALHVFPVWPESRLRGPFGVVRGDDGWEIMVGTPRGRNKELVPEAEVIPGYEAL